MSLRNRPSKASGADNCASTQQIGPGLRSIRVENFHDQQHAPRIYRYGAGSIGLTFFASSLARQDQLAGSDNEPGDGIIVRSEVIRLCLPRTLIELAKRQTQQPPIRTHEDLRRRLEVQHHRDLWYAVTVRGLQVNGEFVDLTFIRTPYTEPARFAEFLEVLAAVTGNPPDLWRNLSSATVHLIPETLSERDPREVISELIGQHQWPAESGSHP